MEFTTTPHRMPKLLFVLSATLWCGSFLRGPGRGLPAEEHGPPQLLSRTRRCRHHGGQAGVPGTVRRGAVDLRRGAREAAQHGRRGRQGPRPGPPRVRPGADRGLAGGGEGRLPPPRRSAGRPPLPGRQTGPGRRGPRPPGRPVSVQLRRRRRAHPHRHDPAGRGRERRGRRGPRPAPRPRKRRGPVGRHRPPRPRLGAGRPEGGAGGVDQARRARQCRREGAGGRERGRPRRAPEGDGRRGEGGPLGCRAAGAAGLGDDRRRARRHAAGRVGSGAREARVDRRGGHPAPGRRRRVHDAPHQCARPDRRVPAALSRRCPTASSTSTTASP